MTTIIILGATGDLTKKKLIPAIYRLVKEKSIDKFAVVGVALSNANAKEILKKSKKYIENFDAKTWKKVENAFYYHHFDFYNAFDYTELKKEVDAIERSKKLSGNRIFYLATLPQHFDVITHNLDKSGIAKESGKKWSRVVYEKPFGEDLKSAKKINRCIARVFKENQVYRIDHYLGKELVENIALIRFTNRILEPLWNNHHIESVQVVLSENFGVKGRGKFYDTYGAIKDVVQNHLLQLVALTAMESPAALTGESIRNAKVKVLRNVQIKDLLLGQYQGFKKEKGVAKNSKTETFAALHLRVNNNRWRGVPFYVKTGKNLAKREAGIYIKFKKVDCLLTKSCPSDTNHLIIRIQPDEGIEFEVNMKKPGLSQIVVPTKLDFCHSCVFGPNTPNAYQTLLEEVIRGNQSVFVRNDEIEQAWKIVDRIQKRKAYPYTKGSDGPTQLKNWNKKHGVRWLA